MQTKKDNNVIWISLLDTNQIIAGYSTRKGGYSSGSYSEMNLGINTADDKTIINKNRELFFSTISPSMSVCHLNQTHSNRIFDVDNDGFTVFSDGDGLITTQKNKLLCVTIADCGSVLFHDDEFSIACAIHCGWRGVKDGIIQNALNMLSEWTDLQNISAYVGPMIRCSSYEVGKEFLQYFGSEYFKESDDKLYFDLNAVIITQLIRANLASITDCGYDTFSNEDLFFSHRRNNKAGRMCAFIGLR